MNEIEELFNLNYPMIIMGIFIIILGVDKIVFLLGKIKKAFRIKLGYEQDKETVEDRIAILEKHDNWQYKEISKISQGIDDIKQTLIQKDITDKAKTVATLRNQLYELHGTFVDRGYVDKSGLKTFLELGNIYEDAGGNDVYHDKLKPEVMRLPLKEDE
jgi:hypothetical protein